jgi:heme/copper-type cytochrome/quinol oxidase subunit 2
MRITRRTLGFAALATAVGAGVIVTSPLVSRPLAQDLAERLQGVPRSAQDQAPNRREFTVTAKDYRFAPSRLEVTQDDLVKLTVQSADVAYSLTIDAYRVSRRIAAGGSTTLEFRADRSGSFVFYSNLTIDNRHAQMRGELVVVAR